ncbi:MAG: transposase [Muribaculaceae bacterium]|nr:transposase [Muribaculaceae bacterium]
MQSFSQIYIMSVFGVKYRDGVINPLWREKLFACIGQTLKGIDGVMPIAIGGIEDHVHVFYSTKGNVADAEIVRRIKTESSLWVNSNRLTKCRFAWQRGGARISYSYSAVPLVKRYIETQVEHHKNMDFRQEYELMLRKLGHDVSIYDIPEEMI